MEGETKVEKKDIEFIKSELSLIKEILLSKNSENSISEEFSEWDRLSDEALEDFEKSLK